MSAAQQLLDQVQSPARIDELESEPAAYAARLAGELGAARTTVRELEATDERLRHALDQLDAMIVRVMRIRLDHVLAADTSIQAPTRKVFAATVVSYAGRLELLATRAHDVAVRGGATDPATVTARVVDAARASLNLRDAIRAHVLDTVRDLARASIEHATSQARDRHLDDATRRAWSAARRELEALVDQPDRIVTAAMPARLAAWPEQLDEPDPEPVPTIADLIELD